MTPQNTDRIRYISDGLGEPYWKVDGRGQYWTRQAAEEALAKKEAIRAKKKALHMAYQAVGLELGVLKIPNRRLRRMVFSGYVAMKNGVEVARWSTLDDVPTDPTLLDIPDDVEQPEPAPVVEQAPAPVRGTITDSQVDQIMALIWEGRHEEGGFYVGPTTREGVEAMSREDADLYLTSLQGEY
ncbi:MAG: hypothetical protein Q4D96_09355 [Propionibacteriaceae bacterium]|nr:hypothetical protein [Propionibacteriaceae bacterium]